MLVLTRHKDETIMIGDTIEVTILEVKGDKIKVGIKAPLDVPVHRKEIYLAIKEANIAAAQTAAKLPPLIDKLNRMDILPKTPKPAPKRKSK
ncbi:MAG: carbon storage regulator CsrA [Planctomycetes bacterium]|nr:carbon storage regulator CsrA [Planctomycetota bacterium]